MKEKLIIALLITNMSLIIFLITGCCMTTDSNNAKEEIITTTYKNNDNITIFRDNETGQEYIVYKTGRGVAMTPRLNKAEGEE